MLDCEDSDLLSRWYVPIERHVSGPAEGDHQLAKVALDRSPQEGMIGERLDRGADRLGSTPRGLRIALRQEFERSLEVREGPAGVDYLRHRFGRCVRLPRARRSIHAWTSVAL